MPFGTCLGSFCCLSMVGPAAEGRAKSQEALGLGRPSQQAAWVLLTLCVCLRQPGTSPTYPCHLSCVANIQVWAPWSQLCGLHCPMHAVCVTSLSEHTDIHTCKSTHPSSHSCALHSSLSIHIPVDTHHIRDPTSIHAARYILMYPQVNVLSPTSLRIYTCTVAHTCFTPMHMLPHRTHVHIPLSGLMLARSSGSSCPAP